MLNNWVCRQCNRVTTEYETLCEHLDCDGKRGFVRWLLNVDNPCLWIVVLSIILGGLLIYVNW